MSPLRCGCGDEVIPGSLYTPEHAAAWAREHEGHGAPVKTPRAMMGDLPADEARALARELRAGYIVGLGPDSRDGWVGVHVKPRKAQR